MGTPLQPNAPGNLCDVCWGPGEAFGPAPTPSIIQLRLTDLLPGQFAGDANFDNLLVTHWLTQTGLPCLFNIIDGLISWSVNWNPTNTSIGVFHIGTVRSIFNFSAAPICQLELPNTNGGPTGTIAWNRFANITWDLEGLS